MARHQSLTQQTGLKIYFAHPHSPWERGINENTNGLLRQYLPREQDLSTFTQQQLDQIASTSKQDPEIRSAGKPPQNPSSHKQPSNFVNHWSTIGTNNPVVLST